MAHIPAQRSKLIRIQTSLDHISRLVGAGIAWLTLGMVIVTFVIVVLRYAFNTGWIAMQESVIYMHATVFMLGAAVALKDNAHVRVDIFYQNMSAKRKALVDLTGTLIFLLPVAMFILWTSWDYVATSWELKESSPEAGGIPWLYILKTVIPAMAILITIQAIANMLGNILTLSGHTQNDTGEQHG